MKNTENALLKQDSRILIILMGSLGDVVRGFAVLAQLKQSLSKCHITWLVEPKCEQIVRMHPLIDQVLVFKREKFLSSLPAMASVLRKGQFDITLDMQRHAKSGLFSWLSGSKRRIGFHRKNAKEFNWIFNNEHTRELPLEVPKLEHYLGFIEKLGLPIHEPLNFGLGSTAESAEHKEFASTLPKDFIVLVLGSSWNSKDWFFQGYRGLILALVENTKNYVVLLGDKSKIDLAQKLQDYCKNDRLLNLAGKTSLGELISALHYAKYCIGPDSGPGHIAGALGRPYISLFGPTSPLRTAPFGSEHLIIQSKLGCVPCYRRECPGLGKLCMRLINVETIMSLVMKLEAAPLKI